MSASNPEQDAYNELCFYSLAHVRRDPMFPLPNERGTMRAADVLAVPPGPDRDRAIHAWCASVWKAFGASRPAVVEFEGRLDFCQLRF